MANEVLLRSHVAIEGDPRQRVRAGLEAAIAAGRVEGLPAIELEGQLIRPLVAYAGAEWEPSDRVPVAFWRGVLALQLAHEASLLHDDVVDGAESRRGRATLVAARGLATAVVAGDHLLTMAYRHATATGSLRFATAFAEAVEKTVAGEIEQGRQTGRPLGLGQYREIVLAKSGALLGLALAARAILEERADAEHFLELGRRLGLVYQMTDDLLDYCLDARTGKEPLADHRGRKWTWVLSHLPEGALGWEGGEVVRSLHTVTGGISAARACLAELEAEVTALAAALRCALPGEEQLPRLLSGWLDRARTQISAEEAREARSSGRFPAPALGSQRLRARVPELTETDRFFAQNSRSFRFAAAFFPRAQRDSIARLYAFCRVTDDLADEGGRVPGQERIGLLDEWLHLGRESYDGRASGLPLLDATMREMAALNVPFSYAAELVEGMKMDLRGQRYATLEELRIYSYRVASVVGMWVCGLAGARDRAVLERAAALGHAMQLTNILRDVGEDLRRGRLYIPADWLTKYGFDEPALRAMQSGEVAISYEYRVLTESLLQVAESDYTAAFTAIRRLPRPYWCPVAVAAHVYRGIHGEIRRNGYDNLSRRAHTGAGAKCLLAVRALIDLRREKLMTPLPHPASLVTADQCPAFSR